MNQNTARNHHYLSQFYLKGFTDGRSKKSKLSVIDMQNGSHFLTRPRNVGAIRDFNRVDIEGIAPDALETEFSRFEASVATAIKHVENTRTFDGEERTLILNFIALLALRNPAMREKVRDMHEQVTEKIMDIALSSKDRWSTQVERMKEAGFDVGGTSYESIKEFHDSKHYTLRVPRERHISMELNGIDVILPRLVNRGWSLLFRDTRSSPFITSDHPVVLFWNDPASVPEPFRYSPGYGLKDTTVYFPLSQDCALIGKFNEKDSVSHADEMYIAHLNSMMLFHAQTQAYAPKLHFKFVGEDCLLTGKDLLKHLLKEGSGKTVIDL